VIGRGISASAFLFTDFSPRSTAAAFPYSKFDSCARIDPASIGSAMSLAHQKPPGSDGVAAFRS
jgi:hypothetical protein